MITGQPSSASGMARVQRSSTIDLITHQLRKAIYEGLLMPGSPIQEAQAAKQLGVSRGSLRESAQRLVQDGLLVSSPGQGMSVARVRPSELKELYATRLVVEAAAIRVIAGLPEAERAHRMEAAIAVLARLERFAASPEALDSPRSIGDADLDFHYETVRAARNLRLEKYMATLAVETRLASLGSPAGYIIRTDVHRAHRERLEAVLAGDGEGAVELLRLHFRDTIDRLTGALRTPVATALVPVEESGHELGPIGS